MYSIATVCCCFLDLVLHQESNDSMKLRWQPGGNVSHSVGYEVQVSSLVPGEDFVQVCQWQ